MNFVKTCAIALLIGLFGVTVQADDNASPQFSDYPVDNLYTGEIAAVQVPEEEKTFKEDLEYSKFEKINFAGEYTVVTWGCGSGCLMGAAVSHKTGKVHMLPDTGYTSYGKTNWDNHEPLTHKPNSNLIEIYAWRGGDVGQNDEGMVHYYSLDNDKGFEFIKSLPKL